MESSWLLGYGIKFLSNASVSVLFTKYSGGTDVNMDGSAIVVNPYNTPKTYNTSLDGDLDGLTNLKPMFETYLGLGWSRYICNETYHIDLAAGYDFDLLRTAKSALSDTRILSLHGFNFRFRFDF